VRGRRAELARGVGVEVHLYRPRLARIPRQVALALEDCEMRVDRRRRRQSHRLADLSYRRGIPPLALAVCDEVEDLQPFSAQDLGHRLLLFASAPACRRDTPWGRTSVRDRPTYRGPASKANICSCAPPSRVCGSVKWAKRPDETGPRDPAACYGARSSAMGPRRTAGCDLDCSGRSVWRPTLPGLWSRLSSLACCNGRGAAVPETPVQRPCHTEFVRCGCARTGVRLSG